MHRARGDFFENYIVYTLILSEFYRVFSEAVEQYTATEHISPHFNRNSASVAELCKFQDTINYRYYNFKRGYAVILTTCN